ncbi:glycoside hydrolase family 2 protein [Arthrobacter psychrochitiniphilus]|uniref:glycoside hydrolase family 2 protein n=1 Tax=Arthrobacter psychrochitiniphilus TaxID=291045 RepID=UPI003F7B8195
MTHLVSSRLPVSVITRRELHSDWNLRAAAGPAPKDIADVIVPASVPGVVHLDLMAAGLIPDPYLDNNEAALAWIGLVDWTYQSSFTVSEQELAAASHHELVFDGIDTVATLSLNGIVIAEVANQHRTYRFDVRKLLRAGENDLTVAFRSPIKYANEQSVALGVRPRPYPLPYDAIRKSACSFGWDWGIATFASGLWKAVRLESWSDARLENVSVVAFAAGTGGAVDVSVSVPGTSDGKELELHVEVAGVTTVVPVIGDSAKTRLELTEVARWWPAGYGEQPLYDVLVSLRLAGETLDETTRRVGFRELHWDTERDEHGTPFQLHVNGQPILVKGVNWIPDDAFPSRIGADRYRTRLTQARSAGLNLVRVWGGGIYESDDFFNICDELGLLSWQDFLFACAAYSEEEPLRSEIAAEARDNVARIAHHASLVLLTGNNENLWGYEEWDWKRRLEGKTWGEYYYYELFPAVIADLAAHVPYSPGSPFSPHGEAPNDPAHGTMHIWDLWNQLDWPHYRDYEPRFVAEFGWQGPPAWSTLTRSISDSPLTPESPGMIVHQKATDGNVKLTNGLLNHYKVPEDMETWHWAMQLNQANAITCALDHFRSHAPLTSGAVIWQLNDCWPVTSWAAIDGDGQEKPLFFALRNAFAPRVVTVQPREDGLAAIVGNDTGEPWDAEIVISRRTFDGVAVESVRAPVRVPARGTVSVAIPEAIANSIDTAGELIDATVEGIRGLWFFAEPRDSALAAPQLSAEVRAEGDAFAVTVTAANLVRDITLLVDKLGPAARVDEGLITLLPGESTTFRISGLASLDVNEVSAPQILRSGNQLVVP